MMLLNLYTLLSYPMALLLPLLVLKRWWYGKELPGRWMERFGISTKSRPTGMLIWLHAASVGEVNSVVPVINELSKRKPKWHFLITTVTVTGNQAVQKVMGDKVICQFLPMDTPPYIANFLNKWSPDAALFVDSEIWPNLLRRIKKRRIPLILLNARMSTKSFSKWSTYPKTARALVQLFDIVFPSTPIDHQRFAALGAPNINYIGHLKYSTPPLPCDEKSLQELQLQIGKRPIFLCSSIHKGEIASCLEIHKTLAAQYPEMLTVVAPRHPEEGDNIVAMAKKSGIKTAQRTKRQKVTGETNIYIADTIGELGIFYRLAPVAFIGGSLIDHGGQNMLEPARLGCVPIVGPYTHNFTAIMEEMEQGGAVLKGVDTTEVAAQVMRLLKDKTELKRYRDNCLKFASSREVILHKTIEALLEYVETDRKK